MNETHHDEFSESNNMTPFANIVMGMLYVLVVIYIYITSYNICMLSELQSSVRSLIHMKLANSWWRKWRPPRLHGDRETMLCALWFAL